MNTFSTIMSKTKLLAVAGTIAATSLGAFATPAAAQGTLGATATDLHFQLVQDSQTRKRKGERKRNGNRGAGPVIDRLPYEEVKPVHERRRGHNHRRYRDGGIYLEFGGNRRGRGFCGPRRAVDKAWRMGVNRPRIDRIGRNRIVVKGRQHGQRVRVVFDKNSGRCHVIKTRGLRRYY